jgi:phage gp45-like
MPVYTGDIKGTSYEKNADSEDETITATSETIAGNERSSQIMNPFGFLSRPVPGTKGVFVNQAGGAICLGSSLEALEKIADLAEGASIVFSVSGGSIKGQVLVDADGLMEIKNDVANLKDLIDGLIDSILDLQVLDPGGTGPGNWPLTAASTLAITTAKTDFETLLK